MTLYPIICCTCVAECMKMRCVHDTLSHHLLYMCCRVHENEVCTGHFIPSCVVHVLQSA